MECTDERTSVAMKAKTKATKSFVGNINSAQCSPVRKLCPSGLKYKLISLNTVQKQEKLFLDVNY